MSQDFPIRPPQDIDDEEHPDTMYDENRNHVDDLDETDETESGYPWKNEIVPNAQEFILAMARNLDPSHFSMYEREFEVARKSTLRLYFLKIKTFFQWCQWRNRTSPDVTGDIFSLTSQKYSEFVEEVVRKRQKPNEMGIKPGTMIAYSDALQYLWRYQIRIRNCGQLRYNPKDDPAVMSFRKAIAASAASYKKNNNICRVSGSSLEVRAEIGEIKRKAEWFLNQNDSAQLKWHFAYLACFQGMLRGEVVRRLEMADVGLVNDHQIGTSPVPVLFFLQNIGKVNHDGRTDIYGYLRSKDPSLCVHGSLAMLLFDRFEVQGNELPSFETNGSWFPTKILCQYDRPKQEMSYETHRRAIMKMMDGLNIKSRVKTHEGRRAGAQVASQLGASEEAIRHAGHWNNTSMNTRYSDPLCKATLKALAGFSENEKLYHLPRASLEPPQSLLNSFLKDVDRLRAELANGTIEPSLSLTYFLDALTHLKKVFLQDSVILIERHPDHPNFKHALFQTSEWRQFSEQLRNAISESRDPHETRIDMVAPEISNSISTLQKSTEEQFKIVVGKLESKLKPIDQNVKKCAKLAVKMLRIVSSATQEALNELDEDSVSDTEIVPVEINQQSSQLVSRGERSNHRLNPMNVPQYKMSRTLSTVSDVWEEWDVGLEPEYIAVKGLEARHGTKWRQDKTESRFFYRRYMIIQEIERMARENGMAVSEAVNVLERRRLDLSSRNGGISLNALSDILSRQN